MDNATEQNILTGFRVLIEREVSERVRPLEEKIKRLRLHTLDEEACEAVREQILIANKTWLTRKEAALYLQVSDRSIAEWSTRPIKENPFPKGRAGGEPRYRRSLIDEWVEREQQRQRLKLAS